MAQLSYPNQGQYPSPGPSRFWWRAELPFPPHDPSFNPRRTPLGPTFWRILIAVVFLGLGLIGISIAPLPASHCGKKFPGFRDPSWATKPQDPYEYSGH